MEELRSLSGLATAFRKISISSQNATFAPEDLLKRIPYLQGGKVVLLRENTLTCLLDRNGSVPVSFFGGLGLNRVADPDTIRDNGVQIASLLDVAGCKMAVVQRRAEAKDYRDIAALLENGVDLSKGLAAAKAIYGEQFEPATTLRALSYFADGDLPKLPKSIQNALQSAAKSVKIKRAAEIDSKARFGCAGQRTMIHTQELLAVAKRIFWFGTPEEALEFPTRFLTYAMTYASDEDIGILRKYFSDDDFKATLDNPAPGIFDQPSWAKWNKRYGRIPVPPLPKRAHSWSGSGCRPGFLSCKIVT